jgi:hypothetical protein
MPNLYTSGILLAINSPEASKSDNIAILHQFLLACSDQMEMEVRKQDNTRPHEINSHINRWIISAWYYRRDSYDCTISQQIRPLLDHS